MITRNQIIELVNFNQSFNPYRKEEAQETDIATWSLAAIENQWTVDTARKALTIHHSRNEFLAKPANINQILNEQRNKYRNRIPGDLTPPRHLRDNPRAEIAWRKTHITGYINACLNAWANNTHEPAPPQNEPTQLPTKPVKALIAGIVQQLPTTPRTTPKPVARRTPLDPAQLAAVRRETANRRPVGLEDADRKADCDPLASPLSDAQGSPEG